MLCPDGIVTGRSSPRMTNSELRDWSDEMVTAAFEAVSVACRLELDPTATLPKVRVAGETPSCGLEEEAPLPWTLMLSGEFGSLLTSVKTLVVYPSAVGVKITGNWMLAPGRILTGKGKVPNEKALPCFESEPIRSVLVPTFESRME